MTDTRAPMTPFEKWWKSKFADSEWRSGTVPAVSANEAFEAGWLAAVRAHDESGCIFIERSDPV